MHLPMPVTNMACPLIAQQFLAGLLHHAKGMSLILNPLVNSYKRLIRGFEAPVYITWARVNRSSLIRVPRVNPQKLDTTRLEIRNPDPACNPYLAYAVMLKCGLSGIQEKLQLPQPVEENLFATDIGRLERRRIVAAARKLWGRPYWNLKTTRWSERRSASRWLPS